MRIVYAALRDDYGDPRRGPSFEEQNFLPALVAMGHEVVPYDYVAELRRVGYERMNRGLVQLVREREPDLLFCVLFEEQLDRRVIREVTRQTSTVTFNWFCDDHWRFDGYSRYWAQEFDWFATTDRVALRRYRELGFDNALLTQWACNPGLYAPRPGDPIADVSFVGQPHGERRRRIAELRRARFDVRTFGHGWSAGRLSADEMVELFSRSRINLNFAGASVRRRLGVGRRILQLKARVFEITATGGFLLTEDAPGLAEYLAPGSEVGVFRSPGELRTRVREFLRDEERRVEIARRGWERTRREHTYELRFAELFAEMGLSDRLPKTAAA